MAGNMRRQPVSYRPFRVDPLLQDGLLPVAREGGELERKVADAMFRAAGFFGERADRQAEREGLRDGEAAALAGRPTLSVEGGAGASGDAAGGTGTGQWLVEQLQRDLGLSAGAAAGIVGNLDHETGGFRQLQEVNPLVPGSRGGFGWAQWTGPRRRAFESWAAQQGLNVGSRDANYGFLLHELRNTPEGAILRRLQGVNDPSEAARIFSEGFLRPGIPHMESRVRRANSYAAAASDARVRMVGRGEIGAPTGGNPTPQVDTTVQAPKIVASGGGYRPTGRDTVYGRAFDAAGTKTYLQALNNEIERTTEQVALKYGDDPAVMAEAMQVLKAEQLREHVFDEIRAEYELTFDRRAGRLVMSAQRELEKKREAENRAEFLGRVGDLETEAARAIAGLDPADPNAAASLDAIRRQLDDHYDSAVAHDLITPGQAQDAKTRSARNLALGFYTAQAKALPSTEIPALREEMRKDFAEGGLDGIDAEGWASLESRLIAMEKAKGREEAKAAKDLADRGAAIAARVEAGFAYDPAELGRLQLDARTAPDGGTIVDTALEMIGIAEIFRDRPLGEARAHMAKMRAGMGANPPEAKIAALAYGEKRLAELEALAAKDPVGYEVATGRTRLGIIDTSTPEALASSLATRRDQMERIAETYGTPFEFFRPHERSVLATALTENPDGFPDFVVALREALGERTPAALAELADDAPTLAHAAGLSIATRDNSIAVDIARAISAKKQGLFAAKMPGQDKFVTAAAPVIGGALAGMDRTRASTLATAQLLFEADANRIGFDPAEVAKPGTPAALSFERALNRALGAQYVGGRQTGGMGEVNGRKIVVPTGMEPGKPQVLMSTLSAADLAKLPPIGTANGVEITAEQLRSGHLVTTGDGIYRVALGDPDGWDPQYVVGTDGGFWTLDLRQLDAARPPRAESYLSIRDR